MTTNEFTTTLLDKYKYMEAGDLKKIVQKAKMFYYGLRYPCKFDLTEDNTPINSYFEEQWILSACDEIIERLGFSSATAYSENGVHWSFDGCELSSRLTNLIKPIVGTL